MKALKIFFLIFIFPLNLFAQLGNTDLKSVRSEETDSLFLPLHLGNEWQYLRTTYDSDGPSYSLRYVSVENDTIIENQTYYIMSDFIDLIRYSKQEKKLYIRWNDSDYVHINFNIPNGQQYQILGRWHTFLTVTAESGVHNIFNMDRNFGGYLYIGPNADGYQTIFTDSIGMSYDRSADSFLDVRRNLIEAIIYDSTGSAVYFTSHYSPTFEITPITIVSTSEFNLAFKVKHMYTKILDPNQPPWHSGVDFIESVKMFSYYTNNDSIILNPVIVPYHSLTPTNSDFLISFELDTLLMLNGYTFNYRFRAKDKGIIPEYSNSPDTGYYQCIWDTTTSDLGLGAGLLNEFSISQNYPNPFNPTTNISYQIPELRFVTIKIYDVLGREVETLVNEEKPAGNYEVEFDGARLPSGIYFYRLQVGEFVEAKKMVLLK